MISLGATHTTLSSKNQDDIVLDLARNGDYNCTIRCFNSRSGYLGNLTFNNDSTFVVSPQQSTNLVLSLNRLGNYGCAIDFNNSNGRIGLLEAKEDGHLYWSGTMIV